jgi:hypothetical protein
MGAPEDTQGRAQQDMPRLQAAWQNSPYHLHRCQLARTHTDAMRDRVWSAQHWACYAIGLKSRLKFLLSRQPGGQPASPLTWHHHKVLVHALIDLGGDDLDARELAAHAVDALRRRYQAQEQDLALVHALIQQHLRQSR